MVAGEDAAAQPSPSGEAGRPAAPSPWTAADPYADRAGGGHVAPKAGEGRDPGEKAPSPWTAADPYAARDEEEAE